MTICTAFRIHFFGEIVTHGLQATQVGLLAEKIWYQIPLQFNFIELGAFVVMPNHVHGILIINDSPAVETRLIASLQGDSSSRQQNAGGITGSNNPMLHRNISRVIRWYKGRCKFEIRKICPDFRWQARFHDHIIRNEAEYERISYYIRSNPERWTNDTFHNDEVCQPGEGQS